MNDLDKQIAKGIRKTITWYDMFDFPLTLMELWRFGLYDAACELTSVDNTLSLMQSDINHSHGFYYLKGREAIIKTRQFRYSYADIKVKKTLKISKLFRWIPWIKFIAIVNIYGSDNLKSSSDIDLFIITAQGRIWLSRLFTVGLIKLLNLRPTKNNKQDKFCLSFFIAENDLNLTRVRIKNDLYFSYLAHLIPVYDRGGYLDKLYCDNSWLKLDMPNFSHDQIHGRRQVRSYFGDNFLKFKTVFFDILEAVVKKIQLRILPSAISNLMNVDTRVVINDSILKLHTNDSRQQLIELYEKKYHDLFGKIE
ncbi:MAG: hypothetical protein WCG01_01720 [bacterium]